MNTTEKETKIRAWSGADQTKRGSSALPPDGVLLTKADVAWIYQVTTRTVENWARAGRLSFTRVGHTIRFRRETLP